MAEAANGEANASTHPPPSPTTRLSAAEWLLLLVLAAVQFTHIVDFMIIMPLGKQFMEKMDLTTEQFGLIVAAYTVSAGLASLLAARFLDRFDRKSALLTLYAGFTVGTLLCAIAPTYPFLVAARAVAGGFGGVAGAVVYAIIGDAFPDARRGTATGVIMSAFSVASIAGVPLGLFLAELFGWQAPFAVLGALSGGVLALAAVVLPPLRGHLGRHEEEVSAWAVACEPNHLRAFALMVSLVCSSFVVVPFLASFLEMNLGVAKTNVKYVYLCGGLTTLLTLTWIGRLSDRLGKLRVFRVCALACVLPFVLIPNLGAGTALPIILVATTVLFITTSGRMVPAMPLITNSAAPRVRGSFMSLNSAVQQLSAGAAAWLSGLVLHKDADGTLTGYPLVGIFAAGCVVASVYLAGHLRPVPGADSAPDAVAVESLESSPLPVVVASGSTGIRTRPHATPATAE